jgi:hopanoid biosynthesis associated protein HpnK
VGPTQKKRQLIVTADDLGLTRRVNEAIAEAHQHGIVTTASLMANGRAFDSAVRILEDNPGLDAGLHLNLTEGLPVRAREQIPSLANSSGFLYHHPIELMTALFRRRVSLADLEKEIRAQLQKVLEAGVRVSHIDGHKHVHVVPGVFGLVCGIIPDYGIKALRSTIERTPRLHSLLARNAGSSLQILKQYFFGKALSGAFVLARSGDGRRALSTPRRFYGITQTGFLDMRIFVDIVDRLPNGVSEVMCHPGYVDEDLKRTPTRLYFQRERELELLTRRELRDLLERAGVTLASYRDLVQAQKLPC